MTQTTKPRQLTPKQNASIEQLMGDIKAHMFSCQVHYERALRAYDSGDAPQHEWNQALAAGLGAIMHQNHEIMLVLAALVNQVSKLTDDDDDGDSDEAQAPQSGGLAS